MVTEVGSAGFRPGMRTSVDGPLLERAALVEAIDHALDAVGARHGGGMALEGVAGAGKTRLLRVAEERAAARGMEVRRAAGDDLSATLPWGVCRQLFADVDLATVSASAELAAPALVPTDFGRPQDPHTVYRLLHGLHSLVVDLAQRRPQVLIIDDAQWSDPESLRFVAYLIARAPGLPLGVFLATRTGPPRREDTEQLVTRIHGSPLIELHQVNPLTTSSVSALVRAVFPDATAAFCTTIDEATGGNPFLCHEMLLTARAEQIPATDGGAERLRNIQHVGVRTSILVRLAQLGSDATAVASAVSVLGPQATLARVTDLSGLPGGRAATAIDGLISADILRETGRRLDFVHPVIREAVYRDLGPAARRLAHHRSAALLRTTGTSAEVATHLLAAGPPWEAWAGAVLEDAGNTAMAQGAPARAVPLLTAALEANPDGVDEAATARILLALGRAEAASGAPAAMAHFHEALGALSDSFENLDLVRDLGEALYTAGHYRESSAAFAHGLRVLTADPKRTVDPLLAAQVLAGKYVSGVLAGEPPVGIEQLARQLMPDDAAGEASDLPHRTLCALAAGRRAFGLGVGPAEHRHDAAWELARAALAGEASLPLELGIVVLEPLALSLYISRRLNEALLLLDRVLAQAAERGELPAVTSLITVRAQVHLAAGKVLEASKDATDAVRLAVEFPSSNSQTEMVARNVLVQAALLGADARTASETVDVPDAEQRWGATIMYAWFLDAVGHEALSKGDHATAFDAFRSAGERFLAPGGTGGHTAWRLGAAMAAHGLGRATQARDLARAEYERAAAFGAPAPLAEALRVTALVGERDEAEQLLRQAMDMLPAGEAPLERSRLHLDLGALLRRQNRRAEARELLRTGIDLARECGAMALAERGREELAAAGGRRVDRAAYGVAALTPAELRVAELVATGMTNREVAVTLFVSRKTVEVHLSSCYRKLGITNREQLGSAMNGSLQEE